MNISPVSFTGTNIVLDSKIMGRENFWDEAKNAGIMREKGGVDVPIINAVPLKYKEWRPIGEYRIKGDRADVNTNPIEEKHFKSLFKNLFLIDKPHGYHGNLNLQNLYFSDNGGVEITTFRYLSSFRMNDDDTFTPSGKSKQHTPPNFMPSNAENFEEYGLSRYLRTIKADGAKYEFMKKYLAARGEMYNSKRLEMLLQNEFSFSSDAVRYEAVQKEIFKDPRPEVVDFNLKKMEMYAKKHDSILAWADGNGQLDGILKPKARFNSIVLMLDCLKDSVRLSKMAEYLSVNSLNTDEAEYFELEKQKIDYFADEVLKGVKVRGSFNFNDKDYDAKIVGGTKTTGKGLYLGFKESLTAFNRLYSKIDLNNPYEDTLTSIEDLMKHYTKLIHSWDPSMNSIFKGDYVA